jgi:MYXO-CTERM domain-containing protein
MNMNGKMSRAIFGVLVSAGAGSAARAGLDQYGDQNLLNTGTYSSDPTSGTTLLGLTSGQTTVSPNAYGHGFPFSPDAGDYPGTDQIYVGSNQTAFHDGYSQYSGRIAGPQVIPMSYADQVPAGQAVSTLTLGIMTDDFQFPVWGDAYTASVNGVPNAALTSVLNSLNETGPEARFVTVGIDPSILLGSDVLTLSIDEGGDGGDGWAIDFLTVGVTTTPVPEPEFAGLGGVAALGLVRRRR